MNGLRKNLPARPSQDLAYGKSTMNGRTAGGQNGMENRPGTSNGSNPSAQGMNGAVMLESYRNEITNGLSSPRFNPMNTSRPQSSMLLNVNDPIQVHLLVETALGDSKEFEILAQEEVDDLKKQVQYLSQRIEQIRQNLAIQSKYRDAAISMSKLYSPSHGSKSSDGSEKKRRSVLGHRSTNSMQEADAERDASERKCEELAAELWTLEKRLMDPQNRLLKHTAGILQMTHKGPKTVQKGANGAQQGGGVPGSPESLYTYSNTRSSMEPTDELFFDERSLYRAADRFDAFDINGLDNFGGPSAKGQTREQMQLIAKTEERLQHLNSRLREVIVKANPDRESEVGPPPSVKPTESGDTLQNHLEYLEKSISTIDQGHSVGSRNQGAKDTVDSVLTGLWELILSGEEDIRQRKQERKMTRSAQGLPVDEDDISTDEENDPNEPFSVHAFSSKVQWLFTQATRLKDQKKVLQRQIKQQRELNSKSDATKDAEITQRAEELERTKNLLTRTEMDSDSVREQLSLVMDKLDEAHQNQSRSNDDSLAVRQAQVELDQRNVAISALEEELQELKADHSISNAESQGRISDSEARITALTAELAAAAVAQNIISEKDKELEQREKEMEGMNMKLAELQTEVTIARAELDGAYGTRAQRAAEVAANPVIQKEIDDLTKKNSSLASEIAQLRAQGSSSKEADQKMQTLKKELEETIEEYELMTKASIDWEKERESLEGTIDKLRDEREALEAQLSDEKVRWLGMKSPGVDAQAPGSTSTTVLKNEFKKMMRDTRSENQKALRAEQAERRKLEDELRLLKRQQGPGKSGLSQSIGLS